MQREKIINLEICMIFKYPRTKLSLSICIIEKEKKYWSFSFLSDSYKLSKYEGKSHTSHWENTCVLEIERKGSSERYMMTEALNEKWTESIVSA